MKRASALSGSRLALLGSAPGPLLDRRVEEDLQVGVGQDDRPDVAPGHDDPAGLRGQRPLALEERRPQLRDPRHGRDRLVDARRVDVAGDVDAVDGHVGQPAVLVGDELDLGDERDERGRVAVGRRRRALEGQPGRRAVEQARVAEPVAELERRSGTDARLAGRAGAVEGDDESGASRSRHGSRASPRAYRQRCTAAG